MALVKCMISMGKPIAYFPNIKRITKSATAAILLCQLIYWSNKTKDDGWIWKNSFDLEEETGLTYNEQRSARKRLLDEGLIEEREQRTKHRIDFRVNVDKINELWEKSGDAVLSNEECSEKTENKPVLNLDVIDDFAKQQRDTNTEETPWKEKKIEKKGDWVDGLLSMRETQESKKSSTLRSMKDMMKKKLHINPSGSRWDDFIEFSYIRQTKHNEPLETFIKWALKNRFDPIYWTPEKMSTYYPQAFVTEEEKIIEQEEDEFLNLLPQIPKDKKSVPMPKDMKKNTSW